MRQANYCYASLMMQLYKKKLYLLCKGHLHYYDHVRLLEPKKEHTRHVQQKLSCFWAKFTVFKGPICKLLGRTRPALHIST